MTALRLVAATVRFTAASLLIGAAWLFLVVPGFGFVRGSRPRPDLSPAPRLHPDSRLEQVGAVWHCHLAGSARDRGYACGRLTAPMMAAHEGELFATLRELVPWFPVRHAILGLVNLNNRNLDAFFLPDELDAVAGIARGYQDAGDPNANVAPAYGRILGYHALHDVSQYLIDNPLITAPMVGCSAVAVGPSHSADGHVLVGRLFDFEGGRSFDFDKVVYTVAPAAEGPERRFCHVHVAWGGMHGAVTGANEAGLWISVNAGVSDHFATGGRPLVVAVLRALETCASIDEAVAQLAAQPVFVSESVLLASGQPIAGAPAAVCLELAPGHHRVRVLEDDRLVVTNHFEHPGWSDDVANGHRRREGTTTARNRRLHELLDAVPKHTPTTIATLLRDRRGVGDDDLGFGNRATVNAWIGAHLVVADLTAGVLWVAEPRHGLGAMRAFDVHGPRPDLGEIAPSVDRALYDAVGATWSTRLSAARRAVAGRAPDAANLCRVLIEANPRHYEPYALLAVVTADRAAAADLVRQALERRPAYAAERRELEARLQALTGPAR
ncbi:MAG: C45 family peptidase [Planctomycetota bacterium]